MNPLVSHKTPPLNRRECLFALGAIAASLSGCGGGGSSVAGVSSGGTGSLSAGTITGFGSVFINGVKYEDGSAVFTDGEGGARTRDELKLGMVAVIDGSSLSAGNASASVVSFGEEVVGRITSIDAVARTFVVLDQVIEITGSTVFEAQTIGAVPGLVNGFASLAVNEVVEIHGYTTPAGLQATRVQREDPAKNVYRLQGTVSNHVPGVAGGTFNIGTLAILYTTTPGGTEVRVTPANGTLVRVRLDATLPSPPWTATRISRPENTLPDRSEAEVNGTITSFTSAAQFSVNGIPVNASGATRPAGLATGVRVEVEGSLQAGVLTATTVRIEDRAAIDSLEYEVRGPIEARTANTITVRDIAVNVTAVPPTYVNGDATKLAIYAGILEVKGQANATGTEINATHIRFQT